jgi:hypothetical protein
MPAGRRRAASAISAGPCRRRCQRYELPSRCGPLLARAGNGCKQCRMEEPDEAGMAQATKAMRPPGLEPSSLPIASGRISQKPMASVLDPVCNSAHHCCRPDAPPPQPASPPPQIAGCPLRGHTRPYGQICLSRPSPGCSLGIERITGPCAARASAERTRDAANGPRMQGTATDSKAGNPGGPGHVPDGLRSSHGG